MVNNEEPTIYDVLFFFGIIAAHIILFIIVRLVLDAIELVCDYKFRRPSPEPKKVVDLMSKFP